MSQLDSANQPGDQFDPFAESASPGFGPSGPAPAAPTPTQKQGLNVYTMMLVISFIAMCIAVTLMYLELTRFGSYPYWNTSAAQPQGVSQAAELLNGSPAVEWISRAS